LRISAEAHTGDILLLRAMSSDPQGRNRAERSDVWWQSQDFAEWTTRPGDSAAFLRASRPTTHSSLPVFPFLNLRSSGFVRQVEKGWKRW